jgi:hypothetical protein
MASYMGRDEEAREKMFLRDAVVNDNIPPITRVNISGFYAYRFGHAVFDFMEDRWGKEGFRISSSTTATRLAGGSTRRSRKPSAWIPRTSTSSSGAGCARSTCRSW